MSISSWRDYTLNKGAQLPTSSHLLSPTQRHQQRHRIAESQRLASCNVDPHGKKIFANSSTLAINYITQLLAGFDVDNRQIQHLWEAHQSVKAVVATLLDQFSLGHPDGRESLPLTCTVCSQPFGFPVAQADTDLQAMKNDVYQRHRTAYKKLMNKARKLEYRTPEYQQLEKEIHVEEARCTSLIYLHYNWHHLENIMRMDLHGLHQQESLDCVSNRLDLLRNSDAHELTVIVGVGSNSLTKEMIKPALMNALQAQSYRYHDRYAGMLIVKVKR